MKTKKRCIIDSSSAILLYKAGLFHILIQNYAVILSTIVYKELTRHDYPGSNDFARLIDDQRVSIVSHQSVSCDSDHAELKKMGPGEMYSILLFHCGQGDFLIIDDKKGARYCRKKNIPYINALLGARIMHECSLISAGAYNKAFVVLQRIGHYAEMIIRFVEDCDMSTMTRFYP